MTFYKSNNNVIFNQLRLKLLYKSVFNHHPIKANLCLNINDIKSFNDDIILENLFLLEFVTHMKSVIKNYKKSYQSLDIQLNSCLKGKYVNYYLGLLKIFYFPLLKRRNNLLSFSFDNAYNISFSMKYIKDLPFFPEIYYKNKAPIIVSFYFKSNSKKRSLLLLDYYSSLK